LEHSQGQTVYTIAKGKPDLRNKNIETLNVIKFILKKNFLI